MGMAKFDSWMPLYVADYKADTTRLNTEQHGAYLLILMDYWRNGPPPNDDKVLAQITGLTVSRWKSMRPVIERFFTVTDVWKQKRADREMAKASELAGNLSDRGKKGAEARWNKDSPSNATSITQAQPDPMLADAPSPSPSPESTSKALSGRPDVRQQAAEILDFLNAKTGRKYKPVKANLSMIEARLRDFPADDIRAVIVTKCREWGNDEKMADYLRPKTLFAASNFANYEGQLPQVEA
jgi:uncharacterized phage protein (TIGR02220 family)